MPWRHQRAFCGAPASSATSSSPSSFSPAKLIDRSPSIYPTRIKGLRSAEEHGTTKRPFFTSPDEIYEEEYYEEQLPEKKRCLTPDHNQHARWKNKQLEQDFDRLKSSYESLLADHAALFKDNEGLRLEKLSLDPQLKSKDVVEATKQVSVAHTGSSNAESSSMWTPSEGSSTPVLSEFTDGGNYYVPACYASPAYFIGGGEL
ncbi:hypothetical protein ZIOFF_062260 [Zingiber officinale]|uniref:Homeobox-leucine zipper protein n=1 Tax=Zingiber officinale TaxID=94328 RepID=A0A8J5F408_ZINOF|nr:hypothetical protein ZIOFF_062260 [Zingiber officinale]